MSDYDCTLDVLKHKKQVESILLCWSEFVKSRGLHHDDSKLNDPTEKAMFDHWTPELRRVTFGTDEYKAALEGMGEGVKLHYQANRHHPEHFENGVNGMTLIDLIEMVADWMAAADRNNVSVDLIKGAERFDLSDQLIDIIANTLREEDLWNAINGHRTEYTPEEKRKGHVEGFE